MSDTQQPLVNILTPVYNGERYLADCIQSVLDQDYDNWEYTIIDNASTDGTAEILARFAAQDARIRVIRNQETVGALENHNIAVRAANPQSVYCKIQHADDLLLSGCIRKMVEVGERHPTVGLIGGLSYWGDVIVCDGLAKEKEFFTGQEVARSVLLQKANPFWSPSCLMHRTLAAQERVYFYDEDNLHADVQSDYEILRAWDFAFVHEPLTYIRSHEDSRTSTLANPLRKTLATNLEMLLEYGPEYLSSSDFDAQVNSQINHYYQKLAVSFFELRGLAFWRFHKQALQRMGKPLSLVHLLKRIAVELRPPLSVLRKWSGLRYADLYRHERFSLVLNDLSMDLSGQRALVTGATSGIGEALAYALARQGVGIVLLGRNREKLDTLQTRLNKTLGVTADTIVLDLADDITPVVDQIAAQVGVLNLLIHCAGVLVSESSFDSSRVADLDMQYRVNLRSPYLLTRAFLPALRTSQGQVVFVNSSAAQQKAKVGAFSYTVTKYGLVALADGLRDQVNSEGIRVVSVYPGKTATPMQQQIYASQNRDFRGERMLQAEDVAQTITATLVLPRTAEVTDISVRPFLKE